MNRIKQILNAYTSKQSSNTDTFLNINLEGTNNLLPADAMDIVLDINQQFNTERQSGTFYRLYGKINPLVSNVLFNTTGTQFCWEIFSTPIFTETDLDNDIQFLSFSDSIKANLKEIDGWYGYFDPVLTAATLCNFYDMEPKRERFSFLPDTTNPVANSPFVKNWNLTITYPYSADTTHPMINGGLLIIDKIAVVVGGKNMTALSVPVSHNLSIGDTITLTGTNMDGTYDIKRLGLDDGSLQNNYFCLDMDTASLLINDISRMIKMYNGIPSQYYFRKFKIANTRTGDPLNNDDYEIYKLAFSENVYTDDISQFIFNEDIDVNNLVDNLGRPLSELYLTIIKTDSNGIFTNVSSGIEVPFIPELNNGNIITYLRNIPVIQLIHNVASAPTQSFNALELDVNTGTDYYGDVVEYNITTVEEVILSDVYHRFNTINRETTSDSIVSGPRPEGYYYKAHNLIRIRNFSSYIENGTSSTVDIPSYSVDLGDGRFIWRDLLDIGVTDVKKGTLNYPFVNGCHYMFQNYTFDVRRQDPFDNWNIYYAGMPSDPVGNRMTNNFNINQSTNVC